MSIKPTTAGFLADGIHRLMDLFEEDLFTFVMNGQEYSIPLFEAVLLSPRVFSQLKMDNTTRRYVIENSRIASDHFQLFILFFDENELSSDHRHENH
jgi:hypothetical protein